MEIEELKNIKFEYKEMIVETSFDENDVPTFGRIMEKNQWLRLKKLEVLEKLNKIDE